MLETYAEDFLSNKMKIDLDDLYEKLGRHSLIRHKGAIVTAIHYYISQIHEQQNLNYIAEPHFLDDTPAEQAINCYYNEHFDESLDEEAKEVSDSLRHAFCSFAFGGLHQLFTRQENEVWYPSIVLDSELTPNDIENLPSTVVLYRGTDCREYESRKFRQSWTTSLQVAKDFAFKHYQNQPWFSEQDRVVLKTVYPKSGIYFSDQRCEFEVAINTRKIGQVEVVSSLNQRH